ncbi:hypothetical protein OESDEN_09548 [Oesophagostomum dentatum]|uniref:DUF1758 domain-containing protein n=1 Tax=Oesophagostomum dentatum TaxID=61180 RepID=A0A0B1T5F9_OESDE|nr:hypothetical protein OESDEN_09548 [Oesophagostomum dentatum]
MLLDTGSERSYIREQTVRALDLHLGKFRSLTVLTFGGRPIVENSADTQLTIIDSESCLIKLSLNTRPAITKLIDTYNVDGRDRNYLENLGIFPRRHSRKEVDIDVLLRIDYFWKVVNYTQTERLPSGMVLTHTRFGPIISGYAHKQSTNVCAVNIAADEDDTPRDVISKMWDLETIGIRDDPILLEKSENEAIIEHFYNTVFSIMDLCTYNFLGRLIILD